MTYLGHLENGTNITIITDSSTITVPADHINFSTVKQLLNDKNYDEAINLADACTTLNAYGDGKVTVQNGNVYYNGAPLDNSMTVRILRMYQEGENIEPMVKFLENLMENPSGRAVKELYRFLEANDLPITPDGYFLAYKNVNENYKDNHSNTFDNRVGSVCEMPRNEVMDDPNVTCSTGLHFCSIHYLNTMWGHSGHTMIVKINPRDVVSIPVDYNNSKGRCCRYEVVAEHSKGNQDFYSTSVYSFDDEDEDEELNPLDNPYGRTPDYSVGDVVKVDDGFDFDWYEIDSVVWSDYSDTFIYSTSSGAEFCEEDIVAYR